MPVALAGSAPATFEIKSAHLPLVAFLLKSADLAAVTDELARRFDEIPDFFDNDPLVVDMSALPAEAPPPDFAALVSLLRRYRVAPIAARGGNAEQMAAALAAGLAAAPDAVAAPAPKASRAAAPAAPLPAPAPVAPSALVIDKPLRSGQQVYAKGRDLVVMAMVNPGAEVIADGHIHVYAPLRGKAIAGARGNEDARIFSLCLEAQLISISGIYRTSDVPLPADVWGQPTQIRLAGEKLVIEALKARG
ncbi:septum site-determining protein MinC [Variovorax terrae]|uniref:Probable septum site-determining protein MinC n=1 Tax=Variovorax terrae TaxID=2923278 RepID=A0A9X1VXQ1_9BURK|nr:septum site-determining protein MinC [Variovorax terrae]MCJ0765646.1 septum site-determining protein MinC [Variovorax terrae]